MQNCKHENIEYFFSFSDCIMEITKCCSDCLASHEIKLENNAIFTQDELKIIYERHYKKRTI